MNEDRILETLQRIEDKIDALAPTKEIEVAATALCRKCDAPTLAGARYCVDCQARMQAEGGTKDGESPTP